MDYFDDIKEKYFMFSCKTKHFFSVLLPGGDGGGGRGLSITRKTVQ